MAHGSSGSSGPLSLEVARVQDEVAALRPRPANREMEGYYRELAALHPDDVDPADLERTATPIVRGLFAARVTVQERLAAFYADGELSPGVRRRRPPGRHRQPVPRGPRLRGRPRDSTPGSRSTGPSPARPGSTPATCW